jgi:hypothetical protein
MVQTNDRVRTFLTRVGGPRMMEKVGVGERMIRHAARENRMPATWYMAAVQAAEEAGIEAPDPTMFDFKKTKK